MNFSDCKKCEYLVKYHGNKNKLGERTVSNYWCVKKNGFVHKFPKKCMLKQKEET